MERKHFMGVLVATETNKKNCESNYLERTLHDWRAECPAYIRNQRFWQTVSDGLARPYIIIVHFHQTNIAGPRTGRGERINI